jgi:hypothetical protein
MQTERQTEMELNAQNIHVCCLGVAEVAQNKRVFDDTVTWLE